MCGQVSVQGTGSATGARAGGSAPVALPVADGLAELDRRVAKLRPVRSPKLPSDGGTPYVVGASSGQLSGRYSGDSSIDVSLGGPGPLDELELYQHVEKMPAVTGRASEPIPLGLSTMHTSPKVSREPAPTISIARNGSYMEVHARQAGVNRARVGGRRGIVKGFTAASRKRCLRLMACIDRDALKFLPLFMTLTYHNNIPSEPKVWKLQLASFCKRIERRYPGVSIVWKLEPQRRGAPHFHLLVFGVDRIPHEWVAQSWTDIVEPGNEVHLAAGTRVERVKSWEGVMSYAAKYIGKVHEGFSEQYGAVGRYWGVRGKDNLPIKMDSVSLTWNEFYKLRRVMRAYIDRKRVLGHIKRLRKQTRHPERWAKQLARAAPRPGRGYWGGVSMFVASEVALRLYMHVMGA